MTPAPFTARLEGVVRPCTAEDLEKLEWFGAFTHHRAIIRDAFEMQGRGEAVMLVAEVGGFPVGQAWLDLRPRAGSEAPLVWAVRVMAPLRGLGLGARLMAGLESVARARGHRGLELGVETDNPAARAFYERLGWRVTGERQESYGYVTPDGQAVTHALREWVMVKALKPAD
jgi:GNAT superfamily N-acetyltransferase